MRVYQAADGRWIFWDGETKTYYETKGEAEMQEKKELYIQSVRDLVGAYGQLMAQAQEISAKWSALYNDIITDEDMPGGVITDVTSQLSSFTDAIANLNTLIAAFDAGIDTVFERVA